MKRLGWLLILSGVLAGCVGCQKEEKPAPPASQVQEDSAASSDQQPGPVTAEPQPNPAVGNDTSSTQAEPEHKPISYPDFFDTTKAQIKDLPTYPKSSINSVRIAPAGQPEAIVLLATAFGKFEEVVGFYDKEIKKNKWSVYFNTRDPEDVVWKMTKGSRDEAAIEVKLDKPRNQIQFGINRWRKPNAAQ